MCAMKMYIEIERTTGPLDQRYRTGLRGLSSESCLLNQFNNNIQALAPEVIITH
jgi:hypothetical protein